MREQRPTVALIFGGRGCERDVSILGAPYLYSLIDKEKFNVLPLLIMDNGEFVRASVMSDGSINPQKASAHLYRMFGRGGVLSDGDFTPVSMAFPLLHGDFGEDGTIQGALSEVGISYAGCDVTASAISLDKILTKIIAEGLEIKTARYTWGTGRDLTKIQETAENKIGYPMFIKPARLGSSVGISEVKCADNFATAYKNASVSRVLIEERIDIAYEAECAYFSVKNKEIITTPGGICCNEGFYDYDKKYITGDGVEVSESVPISENLSKKLVEYSRILAHTLGLRHLSRIDFFITKNGEIVFNEINTMPGFTSTSLYPRLLKKSGLEPADAVNMIIKDTLEGN